MVNLMVKQGWVELIPRLTLEPLGIAVLADRSMCTPTGRLDWPVKRDVKLDCCNHSKAAIMWMTV